MVHARAAVILAAGKSTRMKSSRSKVIHHVGGRSMLAWVTDLARQSGVSDIVCVVGETNADVRAEAEGLGLKIAVQEPQLGTGHAVLCAKEAIGDFEGNLAVLYADTPLIEVKTVQSVFEALENNSDVAVLGFEPEDPGAYGRLVTENGELTAIVEAKEASDEILAIGLCNSGVIGANAKDMFSALGRVTNDNIKGEYYLTDIVEILRGDGRKAVAVIGDEAEMLGVNSRTDLALAEQAFQKKAREAALKSGVTLRDPQTTYFSFDTEIEADADIGANTVFGLGVKIAKDVKILPFCHIEGTSIASGSVIGPFARLRSGTELGENTKIGNFVETKNTVLKKGSKINHLSYIGDAELGEKVNVGAGTITCNYDGYFKHKTTIHDGAFIGTNSSLVAPVTIGEGAFLGSGGVITDNVPSGALALGRSKQVNKEGWADRYHKAQKARKVKLSSKP